MASERREFYVSFSGDSWHFCHDKDFEAVVVHEPNLASGGRSSLIDLGSFLKAENRGPEHQALRKLIATLVYP